MNIFTHLKIKNLLNRKSKYINYNKKLNDLIPGGAHTYSRGKDQFSSNSPQILQKGKGSYIYDADGNKYLDYGMALRAVTIGYADKRVNKAAIAEINNGNNLTRPSIIELQAAEIFTQTIPGADMVKFAKNGSNATTAAVKLARSYTGKKYICIPKQHPFFSYDDWFIGTTNVKKGIPGNHYSYSLHFDYNNLDSLKKLFIEFGDEIAAVILEPSTTEVPFPFSPNELNFNTSLTEKNKGNFLVDVYDLCKSYGALFIADEMITGFRWGLKGASSFFGIKPDLMTFGKAMANGFSLAAVTGRKDIMSMGSIDNSGTERTFLLSTTHGAEMCSLGAFVKTIEIYQEEDICKYLWYYGDKLKKGFNNISKELGLIDYIKMIGPSISLNYITRNQNKNICLDFRTLFLQEMIRNKVLIPWIAISKAHGEKELNLTLKAVRKSLIIYQRALEEGINKYLLGPSIKPVFRKYN